VPDGRAQAILRLQATQSDYANAALSAATYQALAGLQDSAAGLWQIRVLAGLADRQSNTGVAVLAPVFEAALDWMPTRLNRTRLSFAREIDDPDEVSAAPYTLAQAQISDDFSLQRNAGLVMSFTASNAAFLRSSHNETLYGSSLSMDWQLNPALTVHAGYAFNSRQSNFLRAANEHLITAGISWTL